MLILDLSVDPSLYRPLTHWAPLLGEVPWRPLRVTPPVSVTGEGVTAETGPAAMGSAEEAERAALDMETQAAVAVNRERFTHLILTGSEASIVEPQAWFDPAEALVRAAVEAGLPVLGSCFGHQLIVRALAGPAHVRRAARPELGWCPVEVTATGPLFSPAASPPVEGQRSLWMFSCHFDEVCDLPPDWEICARTGACEVHAYRHRERPVWGIQAHPEIDPAKGAALLEGFAARRPEIQALVAEALAGSRRDDGFGQVLVRRFLEEGL